MNIIINGITLNLDNQICEKFEKYLYPITPEECENYAEIMLGIPFNKAISEYGILEVTKKIEEAMLSEIALME